MPAETAITGIRYMFKYI